MLAWLLDDEGGEDVQVRLSAAELVLTSDLTLIECERVLHRAAAVGALSAAEVAARRTLLSTSAEHWVVFAIDAEIAQRARQAFPREPLRSLDAIHIATALVIRGLVGGLQFLTFDERIRDNAVELGFDVVPADEAGVG